MTSKYTEPPIYHNLFAFIGFVESVLVINGIANEVIAVLQAIGIMFDLSDDILGLTILAWGNCIGGKI
jgi:sodium/potassium/calcium exchanger 6